MKKALISFIIFLYLTQLSLVLGLWKAMSDSFLSGVSGKLMALITATFGVITFALGLVNTVLGITHIFVPKENDYHIVMVCKLTMIPYFIINLVICCILCAGLLNPFLVAGLVIVIPTCVFVTYITMMAVSSYNIGHMINCIKDKRATLSQLIVHIICHCIFILDVVSSVKLFVEYKNELKS